MSDKSKVNFVIDGVMFLCMMAIVGIGLLMRFVLIPGKNRWLKYGRNVDLYLAGMDRHEWGRIHLVIGFILLGLLAFHIILHWKMILNMWGSLIGGRRARRIVALAFMVACVIVAIFPFVAAPKVRELTRGEGHHAAEHVYVDKGGGDIEVRGYMMLAEVAAEYNVPIEHLEERLAIPRSTSNEDTLGRLARRYGFRMSEVERVIHDYQQSH